MAQAPAYGTTRKRSANVSYLEIERAALEVLANGQRPSVLIIRNRLGRGSPATIAEALRRLWRDLGVRAAGDPAALTRLPAEIADLADGLWQKALTLAAQAAKHDDNAAREQLNQLQLANEIRAQSWALREREWDVSARAREKALSEARDQIASLMKELAADRAAMRAQVARITDLSAQNEAYRAQLSALLNRTVAKHRALTRPKTQRSVPALSSTRAKTRPVVKHRSHARRALARPSR